MKTVLLEIEGVLSNANAELSMPSPNEEKAKRGIEVARKKLLILAESQTGREAPKFRKCLEELRLAARCNANVLFIRFCHALIRKPSTIA